MRIDYAYSNGWSRAPVLIQTTVTYVYTIGWRNHRIVSLFYDQPAAHHNPQRDPFPAGTEIVDGGRVGNYFIAHNSLTQVRGCK